MIFLGLSAAGVGLFILVCWKYKYFNFQVYDKKPMPSIDNIIEIPVEESFSDKLYKASKSLIGQDVTPGDTIHDSVACVASLQEIYRRVKGHYIGTGAALYSTYALLNELRANSEFEGILVPTPGCIVVCATGTGSGSIEHGHCAIVGKKDWMSNDSKTGLWQANYTRESWDEYFFHRGGFPVYFFKPK